MKNRDGKEKSDNILEKIPVRNPSISYSVGDDGIVTLEIENKGWMNRIFQKFFKKPRISYVHMEKFGSYIWLAIDDKRTVFDIADMVKQEFGEKAEPLYQRLAEYMQILKSYNFITYLN